MLSKVCFKCSKEKSLADFYQHKRMADGHLNKCKECTKKDTARRAAEKPEYIAAYERSRAMTPHRVKARAEYMLTTSGKAARDRAVAAYVNNHPDRALANNAVNNAVRDGRLFKWPVCAMPDCSKKPQGHHPDYSRPLDVVWLCARHHRDAHNLTR